MNVIKRFVSWARSPFGLASILLLLIAGIAHFLFGSMPNAIRYANGVRIAIDNSVITTVEAEGGKSIANVIVLRNIGFNDISIVGVDKSCTCVGLPPLPIIIPAGATAEIPVSIVVPQSAQGKGQYQAHVRFLPNVGHPPIIAKMNVLHVLDRSVASSN